MPTNIGTSSLRMPQSHRATNINAVVISPQKATRPVFLGFIFLRSSSDNTLIKSGRNSTNTAHSAIMPAISNITIAISSCSYQYHSTTTAKVTLPSSLYLRRREPPWRRMIWRDTAKPMPEPSVLVVKKGVKIFSATSAGIAEPLLVISIWMRSSASMVERMVILRSQSCAKSASVAFFKRLTITCDISARSA